MNSKRHKRGLHKSVQSIFEGTHARPDIAVRPTVPPQQAPANRDHSLTIRIDDLRQDSALTELEHIKAQVVCPRSYKCLRRKRRFPFNTRSDIKRHIIRCQKILKTPCPYRFRIFRMSLCKCPVMCYIHQGE